MDETSAEPPSDPGSVGQSGRGRRLRTAVAVCRIHGETEFVYRSDGGLRCKRCRCDAVVKRRRRVKQVLVDEAGGRCVICGYDRYVGGLAFHHLDPATKLTGLAQKGTAISIKRREEAQKCVLLCHNCHAEVEAGLVKLPIHLTSPPADASG